MLAIGDTCIGTSAVLPEFCRHLLEAELALLSNSSVQGWFALEVSAGSMGVTIGLLLSRIPCMVPWDVQFGSAYNVITNGRILVSLAEAGRLGFVH